MSITMCGSHIILSLPLSSLISLSNGGDDRWRWLANDGAFPSFPSGVQRPERHRMRLDLAMLYRGGRASSDNGGEGGRGKEERYDGPLGKYGPPIPLRRSTHRGAWHARRRGRWREHVVKREPMTWGHWQWAQTMLDLQGVAREEMP